MGLLVAGFLLAAGGHGTYLPILIVAAPFSLVSLTLAFFVLIPFWTLIFSLATRKRVIVISLLLLHYFGAICILAGINDLADWEYLYRAWQGVPALLACNVIWYVVGQMVLYWRMCSRRTPLPHSVSPVATSE